MAKGYVAINAKDVTRHLWSVCVCVSVLLLIVTMPYMYVNGCPLRVLQKRGVREACTATVHVW